VSGSPKGLVSETAHPLLDRIAARPQLAALAGALFIGFSGIFYRYAEVSPETATVFRSLYGLPVLGAVAWLERRRFGGMPGSSIRLAALAGIFFAADLLLWHHAIEFIGAGLATVLGNLQVVVVALVAWALLRERPARTTLLALPVVVAGVVLISGVLDGAAYGKDPLLGVGLGILTALAYASYLMVIRLVGRDLRRPAGPVFISTAATAVVAAAYGALAGDLDPVPAWPSHGWLILVGVTSQSVGYVLISIGLPRLPSAVTSIILLAQPVATVALARVLLTEVPSTIQVAGIGLVIGGIAIATIPVSRLRDRARLRASSGLASENGADDPSSY